MNLLLIYSVLRPGNNSSCRIQSPDPAQCRQKRRKLLKQHRLVWRGTAADSTANDVFMPLGYNMVQSYTLCTGAASAYSASLECAQFDDDFVEALKGKGRTFVCCIYLFHHHQAYLRVSTSSMFNSLLHVHKPVSYPGRSYHGQPAQQCSNCHAVFWNAESVGKEARTSSGSLIYNKCCKGGRVVIPPFLPRPEPLASLARFDGESVSTKFMKNIRRYNFFLHSPLWEPI